MCNVSGILELTTGMKVYFIDDCGLHYFSVRTPLQTSIDNPLINFDMREIKQCKNSWVLQNS